ncbi:CopD family protein [Sphingomonas bacterium]|uniref:CopD family protein n=1 Tax=Sphingomonas bacterium TaxID=1895847 RepID=UPI001576E7C5|nr:CopD family protein [Sphingomonas bacterium]
MTYLWLFAAHILFVVFWMAGLFIFPRYLVYHQEALARGDGADAARWVEREGKLRSIILTPAMIIVIALGLALASIGQHWMEGWLHAKLLFVIALAGYHGWAVGYARKLGGGRATLSGKTLRLVNEVPAVGLIAIVILAVVKPF